MNTKIWQSIFYNKIHLRAGWRVLRMFGLVISFLLLLMFLVFLLILLTSFLIYLTHWQPNAMTRITLTIIIQALAGIVAVTIGIHFLEIRPRIFFGRFSLVDLIVGFVLSFMIFVLVLSGMSIMGWIKEIHNGQGQWAFIPIFALVAIYEELVFRRFLLRTIQAGSNIWWGLIGSSLLFGLAHMLNAGANLGSILGISLAGVMLGFAYIRSGNLWMPIGLHFGWDLFEGLIFGFPTSGIAISSLIRPTIQGPALWTGGAFGPEAGLIILPGLMLGMVLIYLYTK